MLADRRGTLRTLASWAGGALLPCTLRAQAAVLRIGGTGSGVGAMRVLAQRFRQDHPEIDVQVLPAIGTSGGIAALLDGRLDIALGNREPNDKERARGPLQAWTYARTPLVLAVGPGVKARSLTLDQLAAMYSEAEGRYPDGQRARPVLRLADATDTKLLQSLSPAVATAIEAASQRRGMLDADTDSSAADLIERTPGAFGPSTLAQILSERRPISALALGGVQATVQELDAGRYPLFKKLVMIVETPVKPSVQAFQDFLRGSVGQRLLLETGHSLKLG